MGRKRIMQDILGMQRQISEVYHKYLSIPREYYPGEKLYMREVHVVMEIGMEGLDNISLLSERLHITNGAVSQYLAKLEQKEFINRIQDPGDKRQFSVQLTEKGERPFLFRKVV